MSLANPLVPAWPAPEEFPPLDRAAIHLWCAWLDEPVLSGPEATGLLAADEQARAAGFYFAPDRRRYIATRALLRRLLGRYTGAEPGELRFGYGAHGKPELRPAAGAPAVQFNVSHCDALALIAIARDNPVGVDLERLRDLPELGGLETQLLAAEALPPNTPEPVRRNHFFRHWTRLEAAGKLCGKGLIYDAPPPDWIEPLEPAADHVGCLAYDGAPARLGFFAATPAALIAPRANTVVSPALLPGLPHRPAARADLYSHPYASGRQ